MDSPSGAIDDATRKVGIVVASCINDRDEAVTAAGRLVAAHAAGAAWRDLLVVAPGKRKWRDHLVAALAGTGVPYRMLLGEPGALPNARDDVVHLASLYGAEGLSFPIVVVVGLGDLPWKRQSADEALRIVVATVAVATRALVVTRSRPSAFVDRVVALLDARSATSPGSDGRMPG